MCVLMALGCNGCLPEYYCVAVAHYYVFWVTLQCLFSILVCRYSLGTSFCKSIFCIFCNPTDGNCKSKVLEKLQMSVLQNDTLPP